MIPKNTTDKNRSRLKTAPWFLRDKTSFTTFQKSVFRLNDAELLGNMRTWNTAQR